MSSPTRPSTLVRGRAGRLLGAAVALAADRLLALVLRRRPHRPTRPSRRSPAASPSAAPASGHGWGMSQYGAYGAARKGLTWKQILAFYYPGTKRDRRMPSAHHAQGLGHRRHRRHPPGAAGRRA